MLRAHPILLAHTAFDDPFLKSLEGWLLAHSAVQSGNGKCFLFDPSVKVQYCAQHGAVEIPTDLSSRVQYIPDPPPQMLCWRLVPVAV